MKDNVLALKVVLANGDLMTTGRRAKKSSAGYDLTRLMVGAEGTLGVITELTLKLSGIPEAISAGVCPFPSVEAACNATIATIQFGVPVARIELLDELQVKATNLYSKLTLPEVPMLFVGPGAQALATDVCVPISRLAECVTATQREIAELGLVAPILGHVGDGNFHLTLLVDMADEAEVKAAKTLCERLVERALAMDGTCTGEHGVGQGKMKYLAGELGGAALASMAAIKRALDPQDIMNPGKIVAID